MVYVSARKVRVAQLELERHLAADSGGRCRGCGEMEPCRGRKSAYQTFAIMGVLPRREPHARQSPFLRQVA